MNKNLILILFLLTSISCAGKINKYSSDDEINEARESEVRLYKKASEIEKEQEEKRFRYKKQYSDAYNKANNGNYDIAIRDMKLISNDSPYYWEAKEKIEEWQTFIQNKIYEQEYNKTLELINNTSVDESISELKKISKQSPFYSEAQSKVEKLLENQEKQKNEEIFNDSYTLAKMGDFNSAILKMNLISPEAFNYVQAQAKIKDWKIMLFNKPFKDEYEGAIELANKGEIEKALEEMIKISTKSPYYSMAKNKLEQWGTILLNKKYKEEFDNAEAYFKSEDRVKALYYLKAITNNSPYYKQAQIMIKEISLLTQYEQFKKDFETAYYYAKKNDYDTAIIEMKKISDKSPFFIESQKKIKEWQEIVEDRRKKALKVF